LTAFKILQELRMFTEIMQTSLLNNPEILKILHRIRQERSIDIECVVLDKGVSYQTALSAKMRFSVEFEQVEQKSTYRYYRSRGFKIIGALLCPLTDAAFQ